jgi:hypothetical protein
VPTGGDVARSNGELANLVAAQRARAFAVGWRIGAFVLGWTGVMAAGIALLLWNAPRAVDGVLAAVSVVSSLLAMMSVRRSRASRSEAAAQLEEAWEFVATELLRARGRGLTAPEVAGAMRTDEAHAESLLARLSARGQARVAVREDSELSYRTLELGPVADESTEQGADVPRQRVP